MDPNVDVEVVMWSITVLVSLYDALRVWSTASNTCTLSHPAPADAAKSATLT